MNGAFIALLLLYALGFGANLAVRDNSMVDTVGTLIGYCAQITLIYWAIKIGF